MADPNIVNPYERIWKTRDLRALEAPIELENNTSQFRRGLNAFGKEMQATGYGLAALGAQGLENVIGENAVTSGITDWGVEGYKKAIDESQSGYNAPNVADVANIKGVGDFTDWASYQLGKGLPMLGSLALSGGVGGAIGRLTAQEGVKQIAKGTIGSAVKKGIETKALQAAEGQIITKAMQETAAKALRDRAVAGAMTGGFAGSFGLEGGLAFGEQVGAGVKPEDAVKSAIAVGGINGALEFLPFYKVAKDIGMGQYAKKSIAEIIKNDAGLSKKAIALATTKELGGRAVKGGLEGVAAEGITEGLQELTSIAGLRWAKQDPLFAALSDDDWNRIGNAAVAGALVGGVAAGAGATLKGPEVTDNVPTNTNTTTSPAKTSTINPAVSDALRIMREKRIIAAIEAAHASGDTTTVDTLISSIKSRLDYLNEEKAKLGSSEIHDKATQNQEALLAQVQMLVQKPVLETPPNEQVQPVTEEQPIPGAAETQARPPLEIPTGPERTGGVREEGAGTETREATGEVVQSRLGESIQLKRGEEIVLTPDGTSARTTPTPEEVEALRQRMGPRPEKQTTQPIEETANVQEVQAQTEAQVKGTSPLYSKSIGEIKSPNEGVATEATMEEFEAVRRQFQERQSQTPFKKWFGAGTPNITATKEGEPITLYHGTNNPAFYEWDSTKAGEASGHPTSGLGFFMTADQGAAARYGNNLLALHAKINNPYTLTDADLTRIETPQDAAQLRKRLMAKGYDGAVVTAPGASPYVIAFQANQIKLKSNTAPTESPDMRYSYAGKRAATANLSALQQAKYRLENKESAETIRKETGWFKDKDNKWKFEISDKDFSFNEDWIQQQREEKKQRGLEEAALLDDFSFDDWKPDEQQAQGDKTRNLDEGDFIDKFEAPIGEFVNHSKLFEAYPQLKNIEVDFLVNTRGTFDPRANYDPTYNTIEVRAYTYDSAKKLLIHELQHAIQNIEGHAAGTHPSIVGQKNYIRSLGEIEARDTANRLNLTEEQRREKSPYQETLFRDGIADEDIVIHKGNERAASTEQPGTVTIPLQDLQSNIDSIMGEGWLQRATEAGLVEVIEGEGPNGESGSWAGDRIRLYTDSMPKNGSPIGVLLHEGKHVTFEDVLGNSLPEYVKDLHILADNGNKVAQDAITHAAIAVADVLGIKHNLLEDGTKADLKNLQALIEQERPGLLAEEELAYFVQYGADAQTGTGFWKRLVNQIKAWFAQTRLGQRMKELGIGFELTDTMAVEWAKMGLNRSLANLQQVEKARVQAEKQAAIMPASARLGKVLGMLEEVNPLYAFAGKKALTANLTLQLEAEQRIKLGESADSVRQDTGWFVGADGKWRFEISDKDMQLVVPFDSIPESKLFEPDKLVRLEDAIAHDKLFAAYPFLKDITLVKRASFMDIDGSTQGWFDPDKLQIGITPYATNPLSTILHELQHGIQMYEGFARGGNEYSVWEALPDETKSNIAKGQLEKLREHSDINIQKLNFLAEIESIDGWQDYAKEYNRLIETKNYLWKEHKATAEGTPEFVATYNAWGAVYNQKADFDKNLYSLFGIDAFNKLNLPKQSVFMNIFMDGKDINKYKKEINTDLTDIIGKITKIKSGDEKTIREGADLYEFYKKLAGETEARLTEARQQMTEEERQNKSPESMMDYPYDKQIVVMDGKNSEGNILYSMGIREITQQLWNDPTDIRPEIVNKPGLLQKWRADFIDFFAEMEKKSKDIYDTYSLLRSKKAARIEQARQEYFLPLRKLITESPWSAQEVGDMAAARHIKVDNVNTRLAQRASYGYTKELLKALSTTKRKELMRARINVKAGKMPDGKAYLDVNGNPAQMSTHTKQQLMFDLMNQYSQYEVTDTNGVQILREEWELFKDAAAGFSNGGVGSTRVRTVDDVLKLADKDRTKFDQIMTLFDAANRHTLELLEDGGLITAAEHARLLLDKSAYAPLRRESYKVDEEIARLFQRAGQGGSKQIATRSGTENLSEPTLVLQNALAAIEAAAAAAERNLANKELYKVVVSDRADWKPWFTIVEKNKYVTHDEDGFLQEKNATASNRADITLINDGKKLVIRPNMHNERAIGFVRAVNNLDAQVVNGPMKVLGWLNQIVRWVNVSASPIFLMTNAFKDPFTAFYNIKATEAEKYTKEIFSPKTYKDSFKALKKVFMDGNRDPLDPDVQWVEKWELAGGRTSFIETLRDMDETWKSFDAQVSRRKGTVFGINAPGFKNLMQAKDKWIDGIENFNILFENVMRFSTFRVLIEKGAVSEAQAARISQDLTTNFTRRGYKAQALGTWWLFFNASVQGNYQVLRNLMSSRKVQAAVGGTVVMALLLDLFGRAVDDDWDKIPEWDKERFIILPVKVAGDFVRIPAPWVYNVAWRTGGLLGEMLSGTKKSQDGLLDIAAMVMTTFSPLGKPGSLAQAISPTGFDPFMQIIENKNFAGNPIGPKGFPGASKKANSELMWSSTPQGYQSFARFVNEATGGSAVESGAIDLKPGDYQILVNFLTGSLGRFMSDATFGVKEALDKDFEGMRDIPVVKEFFSDPYDPLKSQKYHTNIAGIYGAHKLEQMYIKGPERDLIKLQEVRENRGKELRMYSQAQDVERQLKSLRVRLRTAQNRGDTAREKELRDKIGKIQERFNNVYQQRMG